jgi:hypothetical protein
MGHPEYIEPLREEARTIIDEEGGITKRGLDKMKKLDSFLKESQRMNSLAACMYITPLLNKQMADFSLQVLLARLIRKDIKLSNGFVLPAGTLVNSLQHFIHHDPKHYPNPNEFDGFRFERMQAEGQGLEKNGVPTRLTSTAGCSVGFGVGRRVCSGRFLAATKAKLIMLNILGKYDLKLEKPEEGRPKNWKIPTGAQIPDPYAKLVFKTLRDEERYF